MALKMDSEKVRQWLDETGRKQGWLAAQLGITDAAMSTRLKTGATQDLERIAKIMGISYKSLVITDEREVA